MRGSRGVIGCGPPPPSPGEAGAGTGVGVRQLSHVNTNTNLRKEKRTVHCSIKRGFHIMNIKSEGIHIFFSQKRRANLNI